MIMTEVITNSAYFGVALTLIAYIIGLKLRDRLKLAILNPLMLAVMLVIIFLLAFKIDYDDYNLGGKYITFLLTPTTICLAVPLYQKLDLLKKNLKAILVGITLGAVSSLISIYLFSWVLRLDSTIYISLLPKSITTAMGVGITQELGGIETITVIAIMITGITGNLIGAYICRLFRIKNPISVGLAFGTSAHAFGTSKALEIGEVEGAMSSLSIAIAGLITVLLMPLMV